MSIEEFIILLLTFSKILHRSEAFLGNFNGFFKHGRVWKNVVNLR